MFSLLLKDLNFYNYLHTTHACTHTRNCFPIFTQILHVTTLCFFFIHITSAGKMFIKYPYLLTRVGRDGNVNDGEKIICLLYGIIEKDVKGIDDARHSHFVKAKHDLEILPPAHDVIELHIARANYQA